MEAIMSFLLVTAALAAVVWVGIKSLKTDADKVALQPIRIEDERRQRQLRQRRR